MLDDRLKLAKNARPALVPGPNVNPTFFPELLAPNYLDLKVAMDLARTGGAWANFRIASAFNNVASNFLRFAVFVDNDPTFLTVLGETQLCIVQGSELLSAALGAAAVGLGVSLALPPANSYLRIGGNGRRYICLGMQVFVPTTDWTTGGVDAFFSDHPVFGTNELSYASGI